MSEGNLWEKESNRHVVIDEIGSEYSGHVFAGDWELVADKHMGNWNLRVQ